MMKIATMMKSMLMMIMVMLVMLIMMTNTKYDDRRGDADSNDLTNYNSALWFHTKFYPL